jgi:hypothetical protein
MYFGRGTHPRSTHSYCHLKPPDTENTKPYNVKTFHAYIHMLNVKYRLHHSLPLALLVAARGILFLCYFVFLLIAQASSLQDSIS